MKRKMLVLGVVGMLVLGTGFEVLAQEVADEELLFMEIPSVFASSKRLQPVTEAASSVEIITAEEIKQSGAISIADALRSIVGVQVREPSVNSHAIGVRGFADSRHVLITIDGSSAYLHHVNHTYIDNIPVSLEEIERIEIVKGPGGVFYGGSAFSGVINIVTKKPKEIPGTSVNLTLGNWDTSRGNIIYGGSNKRLDYSFSSQYRNREYLSPPRVLLPGLSMNTDTHDYFYTGKVSYNLTDDSTLSTDIRYASIDDGLTRHCTGIKNTLITLIYDRPNFWVRLFHNSQFKYALGEMINADDTNNEIEIMRTFEFGKNIASIGGFGKKVDFVAKNNAGDKHESSIEDYAIKAENEFHATDRWIFTLGGRYEKFSEIGFTGLGRGSIMYKPSEKQRVALNIGSGYYLPSLAELYGWGKVLALPYNTDLKQENVTSYEFTYYDSTHKKIKSTVSLFYNDYKGLINIGSNGKPANIADGNRKGAEVNFNFLLTFWLTSFVNYTYQKLQRDDYPDKPIDPQNMFNIGFKTNFNKWSTNLVCHYVDEYYEIYDAANPALGFLSAAQKVDGYNTVDLRIGYNPTDDIEVAIAGSNLFDYKHYESNKVGWIGADEISRRVTGSVSCRF